MGTSAFDAAWDGNAALDAAYGPDSGKKPLNKMQLARLAQGQAEKNAADKVGAGDYISAALEAPATFAAGVPGAKLLASNIAAALPSWLGGSGDTKENIQREINARTSGEDLSGMSNGLLRNVGRVASFAGNAAGAGALAPVLPATGWVAGGLLGGADQLLNNDPTSTMAGRVGRAAVGAAAGGLLGKYVDRGITAARAAFSPTAASARNQLLAERALEAKGLFDTALAEGKGKAMPKPVTDWLNSPDIAPIVDELKSTRVYENTPVESPEMLDAVYKVLSDRGLVAKGKLAALVPRNANLGRVAAQDIGLAKEQGLNAISRDPNAPMPTYEKAVNSFRNNSRKIDAFDTGYNVTRSEAGGAMPSAKNLSRPDKTAITFDDWLSGLRSNLQDAEYAKRGAMAYARSAKWKGPQLDAAHRVLRVTDRLNANDVPSLIRASAMSGGMAIPSGLLALLSP